MAIWQKVKKVGKYILQGPDTKVKVVSNLVPFAPAGPGAVAGVSKAGGVIKSIWQGVKTFTTKKTINPASGVTGTGNVLKTLGKVAGTGALVGTIFQGGRLISKAGVSGEIPSPAETVSSLKKGAVTGAGLGLSPAGGLIGALEGGGKLTSNVVNNFWDAMKGKGQSKIPSDWSNPLKDIKDNLPTTPTITNNYNFTMPDVPTGTLPTTPQAIYFESPQAPSYQAPSFAPSFSLGGGGGLGESLPLLLLLGAGLGGYAIGKRKKKRYKKRKRHKK